MESWPDHKACRMRMSIGIPSHPARTLSRMESVGSRIRKLRLARGFSQAALARAVKIKPPSLCDIESGKTKRASGEVLVALARALRCDPDYLLRGKPGPDLASEVTASIRAEAATDGIALIERGLAALLIVGQAKDAIMAQVVAAARDSAEVQAAVMKQFRENAI